MALWGKGSRPLLLSCHAGSFGKRSFIKEDTAMNTALVELFKHNRWANLRLLDLCAGLSDEVLRASTPGTFGPVHGTLHHIVHAEENYLHRLLTGQPRQVGSQEGDLPGIAELRERATHSGSGLIEVAGRFQPGEVFQVEWDDGEVVDVPAVMYLVQAINHATEHRAQVLTILTQQGIDAPELSAWGYVEEARSR
jgi:uncharacterized damage-inducible protein DinB